MIRIDHIRVQLPHEMHTQANVFANQLGAALSHLEFPQTVSLKSIELPRFRWRPTQDVKDIANKVAHQIHHAIEGDTSN